MMSWDKAVARARGWVPGGRGRRSWWRTLSGASRRLLLVAAGLMVLTVAGLGVMVWQLRLNALAETRSTLRSLSLTIAEQTARSVESADVVLQDLRRQIIERRLDTVAAFKTELATERLYRFLKDRSTFLPQVDAIAIVAADGTLVSSSRGWPQPPVNLAERDYMIYLRTHDTPAALVSRPMQNLRNGHWTTFVIRRIDSAGGEFIGLVLISMDLTYFRDFFYKLTETTGMTVSLLHRTGTMLTSFPPLIATGDNLPEGSPWYQTVKAGGDVFESDKVPGRGRQLVAVQPLKSYPLIIDVRISKGASLAAWSRVSAAIGVVTLFTIICVLLLLRQQVRQFYRLERSETLLAKRNARLEGADRTLRRQAQALSARRAVVAEQSATLQLALRYMKQGIIMVSAGDRIVVCNEQAASMLDLPRDFLDREPSFGDLIAYQRSIGEFADPAASVWALTFEEAVAGPQVYERTRPNGTIIEVQTIAMQGGGLVRTYSDVTERRETERQVRFLARHDGLTGLLNRAAFHERLASLIEDAAGHGRQIGVFYLDLDGFKQVNDTHGHSVGDRLLVTVASRLKAAIRETDIVARMGGDEFAVVQPFIGAGGDVGDLAQRMLDSVAQPYVFGETRCSVNLSIGVALYPDDAVLPEDLLQNADMALYRAKADGKGRFRAYDSTVDHGPQASFSMEKDLARAAELGQLHVEYQPILDARTLAVVRLEALLRWTHPVLGIVPPVEFIGIAEQSGLIVPIGLWALETACAAAVSWPVTMEVAVNLSPVQLTRQDLADEVEAILARTGLRPARLNLEITEGVLLEGTPAVMATMRRLREIGVCFSLDDFGIAHAGLGYLRQFPFDVLKMDKSFVQDAVRDMTGRGILAAIQAVAVACRLRVVAEGVETEAELALVRELGCDQVQGYLLGRPQRVPALVYSGPVGPVAAG